MSRLAAITGIGVVAPGGTTRDSFWDLLTAGRTATRPISLFDPTGFRSRIAAECDFDPLQRDLTPQQVRRMDRASQMAVIASREACHDSGLDFPNLDPARVGVSLGSAVGATMSLEQEYVILTDGGQHWLADQDYATPHLYGHMVPSTLAVEVAWAVGAEGPVQLISTGCTSGLDALVHACELLRENRADVVVTGATDAPISPISVACFDAIRATSPNNDDPGHASRPFDLRRDGFVMGEGAAILIVEDLAAARRRGADIYAVLAGSGRRSNAFHMTGLRPDGKEMARAVTLALAEANLSPDDVDYVNAHGSGTRQNDIHETAAVKRSFGPRARTVPMSSIKSMVGHSLGAIGSIEVAACALAIRHGVVPPTANLEVADPECDLDYVPCTAREQRVDVALSLGSGFGGFQTAVIVANPDLAAARASALEP